MARNIECGRRVRKDFGKIPSIVEIPNLIEIQQQSYEQFLQKEIAPERREESGLQAVFKSVFPIQDYNGNATLEFHSYHFGDPKYTVEECHDRGMTFAIPLKVTLRRRDGTRWTCVFHTARANEFGHDRRSDRALQQLLAFDTFGRIPQHVKALDVGALSDEGPLSLAGTSLIARSGVRVMVLCTVQCAAWASSPARRFSGRSAARWISMSTAATRAGRVPIR